MRWASATAAPRGSQVSSGPCSPTTAKPPGKKSVPEARVGSVKSMFFGPGRSMWILSRTACCVQPVGDHPPDVAGEATDRTEGVPNHARQLLHATGDTLDDLRTDLGRLRREAADEVEDRLRGLAEPSGDRARNPLHGTDDPVENLITEARGLGREADDELDQLGRHVAEPGADVARDVLDRVEGAGDRAGEQLARRHGPEPSSPAGCRRAGCRPLEDQLDTLGHIAEKSPRNRAENTWTTPRII